MVVLLCCAVCSEDQRDAGGLPIKVSSKIRAQLVSERWNTEARKGGKGSSEMLRKKKHQDQVLKMPQPLCFPTRVKRAVTRAADNSALLRFF